MPPCALAQAMRETKDRASHFIVRKGPEMRTRGGTPCPDKKIIQMFEHYLSLDRHPIPLSAGANSRMPPSDTDANGSAGKCLGLQ